MFIDFKSMFDHYQSIVDFTALIKYKKFNHDCQSWLDVNTNSLTSPNNAKNSNCTWLITANFGFYIILNFKFIEVNSKSRAYIKLGQKYIKFIF